jgi:predicted component of type VI protein secretion system
MNPAVTTMRRGFDSIGALAGLLVAGCVSVKAPDKPIEINLNINVRQEVVVSLKKEAEDVINANPELFPK